MTKKLISSYLEYINVFFAGIYLFSLGCTILNPAFTTGSSASTESGTESGGSVTTSSSDSTTEASTTVDPVQTTSFDTNSIISSSGDSSTSEVSDTSGVSQMCGDCRIDLMEDCDICLWNMKLGTCSEQCDIFYPIEILEKDLVLYCGDFNYCEGMECGQCEADIACYVLHYKKIIKSGFKPGSFKLNASSWMAGSVDPNALVTLTYENIPNGYLIANNGASLEGLYNGDIWLSEIPFYQEGIAVSNISCSIVNI